MLLTQDRIEALARISRFAGWTNRPYGVLEHSLIGAKVMQMAQLGRDAQRAFLLHDLHETAFGGDITTPVKTKYLSQEYYSDVELWNTELAMETAVNLKHDALALYDAIMLAAETRTVFTGCWLAPIPEGCGDLVTRAKNLINYQFFVGDHGVKAFWEMWGQP